MNVVRICLLVPLVACGSPILNAPPEAPAAEDPVVEDPVVEDPVVEDPVVEDPVVEDPVVEDPVVEDPVVEDPLELELEILSYNVAGLPLGLSSGSPAQNTELISPMLNSFDLVLVQEDFGYHDELASLCTLPHQSTPMETSLLTSVGDGLNRFSSSDFDEFTRVRWEACNGWIGAKNDCLTPKGFSFARHLIAGATVDIYNGHFDAGRAEGDIDARALQVEQLLDFIAENSGSRALIVAGDTNMKDDDEEVFLDLLEGAGLTDTCRSLDCPQPQRIDRVMFRSSPEISIEALEWEVDERFVDDEGEPLSDHEAVRARLRFTVD